MDRENPVERYNVKSPCPACKAKTSVLVRVLGDVVLDKPVNGGILWVSAEAPREGWLPGPRVRVVATETGEVLPFVAGLLVVPCKGCGKPRYGQKVLGRYNEGKTCNAACQSATGFQCECRCAGLNHGAAHAA